MPQYTGKVDPEKLEGYIMAQLDDFRTFNERVERSRMISAGLMQKIVY